MPGPTSPILVTGGTGTLGRHVVTLLNDAGYLVRVLSRRPHSDTDAVRYVTGDLATGEGVDAAAAGVNTIVHCAGGATGDDRKTANLLRAASRHGATHLVFISVVGVDRIPVSSRVDRTMFGYFAAKRAAERVVTESDVPWTILRATQFYELILRVVRALTTLPVVPVPAGFRFQPIDSRDVAARMVELALGEPAGVAPDMAGPQVYPATDLILSYLHATGRRRRLVSIPLPGAAARAIRDGTILAPDHAVGTRTWEDFLAETLSARR